MTPKIYFSGGVAAALIATALIGGAQPAQAGNRSNHLVLSVNDTVSPGTVRNGKLSLDEAVRVAGGQLAVASLDAAERRQVQLKSTDRTTIQMAVGGQPVQMTEPLSVLKGLDGAVLDGRGATVLAPPAPPDGLDPDGGLYDTTTTVTAFRVASSGLAIENFTLKDFIHGIEIQPFGVTNIHDVLIRNNTMLGTKEVGIDIAASSREGTVGRISKIAILNNTIDGLKPTSFTSRGISVTGDNAGTGANPEDVAGIVDGVVIRGNTVTKFFSTVIVFGMSGNGQAYDTRGGEVRHLDVTDNRFRDCGDTCVALFGSLGILAGSTSGARITDVNIERNNMITGPSGGVFVVAAEAFVNSGTTTDVQINRLSIKNNDIRANAEYHCTFSGIQLWGGFIEFATGSVENSSINGVDVVGNRVAGCRRAVSIAGAGVQAGNYGNVVNNKVQAVLVRDNDLVDNIVGVQITGTTASDNDYLADPRQLNLGSAVYRANLVRGVLLSRNRVRGGTVAVRITGADAEYTAGYSLLNNLVEGIAFFQNDLRRAGVACEVLNQRSEGSSNVMTGNRASATCPS